MSATNRPDSRGLTAGGTAATRRWVLLSAALGGVLVATGCQALPTSTQSAGVHLAPAAAQVAAPAVLVEAGSGTSALRPDQSVVVRAPSGRLAGVTVADRSGKLLPGTLSEDGTLWESTGPLAFGAAYTASARAVNSLGAETPSTSSFTTIKPARTFSTVMSPLDRSTVGVGMPVILRFPEPVTRKAEVERRLEISTSRPVTGSWSWVSDTEVHYRPETYWPAHTEVTVRAPLRGVEAANGLWGEQDRVLRFTTGAAILSHVDARTLQMTVTRDGTLLRTIPVTTGKAGFVTRSGIKVISEKYRMKVMDARTVNIRPGSREYYNLKVPFAMRVTWSGEFVHGAPWSVGQQGRARVSHGCVGMSEKNAEWFFNLTRIGDVLEVSGTGRPLEANNGWTDWHTTWEQGKAGSALA